MMLETNVSVFSRKAQILGVAALYPFPLQSALGLGPISHVCTGYNHICHTNVILPGQE